MKNFLILICAYCLTSGSVFAQKINAQSADSIVKALQEQVKESPPAFPLESLAGGIQSIEDGLRLNYFGYGERRYTHRFDFHPAMDVGYFPKETGYVTDESGESWQVRSPQSYLKKVYAVQKGELVSIRLQASGYKIVLKHELKTPYFDNDGKPYHYYYTVYRHLDSRSLSYLNGVAREFSQDPAATHEALFGKYVFEAGEQIAVVGFPPDEKAFEIPRAHIDFSLNVFKDPNKGTNIRNYALNPLLLFPPFEYTDPQSHRIGLNKLPAYQFVVDESSIVAPGKDNDGQFILQIYAGGWSANNKYQATRYFALNGLDVVLTSDSNYLASYRIDRNRKLGYSTESYDLMDNPNPSVPHFLAPLGEQEDVFRITVVLPRAWFEKNQYDWSKSGSVSIDISSIWKGYSDGHNHSLKIPLPAAD